LYRSAYYSRITGTDPKLPVRKRLSLVCILFKNNRD